MTYIRNCGEPKPKFALLMRDSRDFLFLKEKVPLCMACVVRLVFLYSSSECIYRCCGSTESKGGDSCKGCTRLAAQKEGRKAVEEALGEARQHVVAVPEGPKSMCSALSLSSALIAHCDCLICICSYVFRLSLGCIDSLVVGSCVCFSLTDDLIKDREPLGTIPLNECSLAFKVLSGMRTIIVARMDKCAYICVCVCVGPMSEN